MTLAFGLTFEPSCKSNPGSLALADEDRPAMTPVRCNKSTVKPYSTECLVEFQIKHSALGSQSLNITSQVETFQKESNP